MARCPPPSSLRAPKECRRLSRSKVKDTKILNFIFRKMSFVDILSLVGDSVTRRVLMGRSVEAITKCLRYNWFEGQDFKTLLDISGIFLRKLGEVIWRASWNCVQREYFSAVCNEVPIITLSVRCWIADTLRSTVTSFERMSHQRIQVKHRPWWPLLLKELT